MSSAVNAEAKKTAAVCALGVPSLGVRSEKGQKKPWQWAPETVLVKEALSKWSEKNWTVSQGSYCVQSTCEQLAGHSRKTHFAARVENPLEVRGVLPRPGDCPERVFPTLLYSWAIADLPKWSFISDLKPLQQLGWKGEKPNIDYWLAYLSQLAKVSLYFTLWKFFLHVADVFLNLVRHLSWERLAQSP